jgi:hypothetical protein
VVARYYLGVQQNNHTTHHAACQTECFKEQLVFQDLGERKLVADFSGGHLSSDGGALLLRQVDASLGLSRSLAACFLDRRNQDFVVHSVRELVAQRVNALALGYEDLNDHAPLRRDPLLAAAAGKTDVLGQERVAEHRGAALASPATLNRLELGCQHADYYRKLHADSRAVEATLLALGVRCLPREAQVLVLDFDATDDPLHGRQEGRFFHGYYDSYCYLPLFCFCGDVCLWAQLRTAERDASEGTVEALEKIVAAIRTRLPHVTILVRADSGFCREKILAWCEAQREVFYCVGLARNARLEALLEPAMAAARAQHILCGSTTRTFAELRYRTLDSWSRERRVIGKAETGAQGDNPRFLVTNLPSEGLHGADGQRLVSGDGPWLYEALYCGRGHAENRIKQMTLDLHSGRTSTHWLASNQMRLWLSAFAYLLLERLRAWGLAGSELAAATLGTIRLRLLKVAAHVRVSVRRVCVQMSSAFSLQALFAHCQQRLAAIASG